MKTSTTKHLFSFSFKSSISKEFEINHSKVGKEEVVFLGKSRVAVLIP